MFADHPVRKKAFLDEKYIYIDFTQWTYLNCFTGLTYDFVQKLEKFYPSSILDKMSLEIMFDDHPSRKQAFLDYTNIDSKQWPY